MYKCNYNKGSDATGTAGSLPVLALVTEVAGGVEIGTIGVHHGADVADQGISLGTGRTVRTVVVGAVGVYSKGRLDAIASLEDVPCHTTEASTSVFVVIGTKDRYCHASSILQVVPVDALGAGNPIDDCAVGDVDSCSLNASG